MAVLFFAQLIVEQIRLEVTIIYIVLAGVYIVANRFHLIPTFRTGIGKSEN